MQPKHLAFLGVLIGGAFIGGVWADLRRSSEQPCRQELEILLGEGGLGPGAYHIEVRLPGYSTRCDLRVPERVMQCDGDVIGGRFRGRAIEALRLPRIPAEIYMKIVRNGVVLSERTIHPVYSGSARGADLVCRFEKVAWPL